MKLFLQASLNELKARVLEEERSKGQTQGATRTKAQVLSSEWHQIAFFRSFGLHWSSPESGDLLYTSGGSQGTTWSRSWEERSKGQTQGATRTKSQVMSPWLFEGFDYQPASRRSKFDGF